MGGHVAGRDWRGRSWVLGISAWVFGGMKNLKVSDGEIHIGHLHDNVLRTGAPLVT